MPNTTIGKVLKQFSFDTGISQKDVAERLHFSPQRVNNYFRDIADPPHEFYEKFRAEFSIDLKRLLEPSKTVKDAASYNPIPVFDLELKPTKEVDFFNHVELVAYYIDMPMFNDCFAAVKVITNQMSPEFKVGEILPIKRITNFDTVILGAPHLVSCEENRFFRYLRVNEADPKKTFLLKAVNPAFDDMILKKSDIRFLFEVKGRIVRL
jgi:transcriptional regulator with XRE-family HTH domain